MTVDKSVNIEFFRDAFVLVPKKNMEGYQTVLIPAGNGKKKKRIFCNCSVGKEPDCLHARQLEAHYSDLQEVYGDGRVHEHFTASEFKTILGHIDRIHPVPVEQLDISFPEGKKTSVQVSSGNEVLLHYFSAGTDSERLISRLSPHERFSRAWLLNKSASFVESSYEREMRASGNKTVRMQQESSLWHMLAYHSFLEFTTAKIIWKLTVDAAIGTVYLEVYRGNRKLYSVVVPHKAVTSVCEELGKIKADIPQLAIPKKSAELVFRMHILTDKTIQIEPLVKNGGMKKGTLMALHPGLCFGKLGYDPARECFFRFSADALRRIAIGWSAPREISSEEFSTFLYENIATFSVGSLAVDADECQTDLFGNQHADDLALLVSPPVVRHFDHIELHPKSVRGSQWTIELIYCCDDIKINLRLLLEARKKMKKYLLTDTCLVDMQSRAVSDSLAQCRGIGADGTLSLSSMSLMLMRGGTVTLQFEGDEKLTKKIRKMFSGTPRKTVDVTDSFTGTLRAYQKNGVAWMQFLYDYYLGGLLCDEMGLGKTIQVIACLVAIQKSQKHVRAVIVCPTSVISHWKRLIERFSPSLRVADYALQRQVPDTHSSGIVLMSYGLMRNDIDMFHRTHFDLVVFDEIQQLKNRNTAGYRAACQLRGRAVIGLTGTPVENSADDLHTLFSIVLPGLSIDIPSETALLSAINCNERTEEISRFRNRIEPFLLRRSKDTVLQELPEKNEENRFCALSPFQRELYGEAVKNRGTPLIDALRSEEEPVPYMHIFSLMMHLKQLCNTPALAAGKWEDYTLYESGKWELCKELLDESFESGQKVVVFTQFLGMVDIFRHYLESINVDFESLTGSSRHRARSIRRFNEDDACRVFIGSLKAGGVGIDLVAASVVIHYDRWWNAAREDQATDRVHRIGQKNGVQVFKLVTENTLEEKIDSIIARKKLLAQQTLSEDDPDSVKQFSRNELMELLSAV